MKMFDFGYAIVVTGNDYDKNVLFDRSKTGTFSLISTRGNVNKLQNGQIKGRDKRVTRKRVDDGF